MAAKKKVRKAYIGGKPKGGARVGTKRSDMRWITDAGEEFDSRFEALVTDAGRRAAGSAVERIAKGGQGCSIPYTHYVRGAICESCGSSQVGQQRTYSPDLFVREAGKDGGYYVEVKGFIRGPKRSLLRSFRKCHPHTDLRFILQSNFRVTPKLTFGAWINKYLNAPYAVFDGKWPEEWIHESPKSKSTKKGTK